MVYICVYSCVYLCVYVLVLACVGGICLVVAVAAKPNRAGFSASSAPFLCSLFHIAVDQRVSVYPLRSFSALVKPGGVHESADRPDPYRHRTR